MDEIYTLPVAKRTRSRISQRFRELHEEEKRKKIKSEEVRSEESRRMKVEERNSGREEDEIVMIGEESIDESDNDDYGVESEGSVFVESEESEASVFSGVKAEICKKSRLGSIRNPIVIDLGDDLGDFDECPGNYDDYGTGFQFNEGNIGEKSKRRLVLDDGDDEQILDEEIVAVDEEDVDGSGSSNAEEGSVNETAGQRSRKRKRGPNDLEVVQILANSILDQKGETVLDGEIVEPAIQPCLPLKFTFGHEEKVPVEKSEEEKEEEKEVDKLWDEMALAMCADGAADDSMDMNEADLSANDEPAPDAANCSQGKHFFVINDEIGVICKFCSIVEKEIRHYTVPFCKNPFGNSERRDFYREKDDMFDELHSQDMDYDVDHGSDFYSHVQGTVWSIIPGIGRDLHPHQREGFEFIWKNIGGGIHVDKLRKPTSYDNGSGCIISHAPGTGKTRLAIVFLQTYMKLYPRCRPVIIAPCGLLLSWEAEFKKWNFNIPFHNLNQPKFSGKEKATARKLVKDGQCTDYLMRIVKLYSWAKDTSVLGLSYTLFENLVRVDEKRSRVRQMKEDTLRKILLEFPGLVVLDEGHTPRNDQSLIWKALTKIQTKKRIILSGTPFQNNFYELFNTLCLVRPQFADPFSNNSRRKSKKNEARLNWSSFTNPIGKENTNVMKAAKSLEELRTLIRPFVHVHRGNILQQRLPGLSDVVVILQPGQLQKKLLDMVEGTKKVQHLKKEYSVSVVSVHPSLLPEDFPVEYDRCNRLDPEAGVKTKFLVELIELSKVVNEKVLVFSQHLEPLKLIGKQLVKWFKWIEGREILHMHGSVDTYERYAVIKRFNDGNDESKVLLASTRACSEGINLVGASRVVLLDVVWNPSVERQAISRAYRLGQKKVVHVYHLITSGKEENKYSRQGEKERLSNLVFNSTDKAHKHLKLQSNIGNDEKDQILEAMVDKFKDILKDVRYPPNSSTFDDF